ncbi:MAG: hypothetical protein ACYTDT_14190 [Planctomycetota bacterium]|jgi:hypothetical protein
MNETAKRIDIEAQRLNEITEKAAQRHAGNSKVECIFVTGSVAQGCVDSASDVDLIHCLNEPFTQKEFDTEVASAKASGGDLHAGTPDKGFGVWHMLDGRKVDFGFNLISNIEQQIDSLLTEHDPDPIKQLIARGIQIARPMHGQEHLEKWQARLAEYPKELAIATVESCLRFMPVWVMCEMGAKRGDAVLVYEHAIPATTNLCGILAALNRKYHPGKAKRVVQFSQELVIKPVDFANRLNEVFTDDLAIGVEKLDGLIREVFDLIDAHLPEVDTTEARTRYDRKLAQ